MRAVTAERAVAPAPFRPLLLSERAVQAGLFLLPLLWWGGGSQEGFAHPKMWLLAALNAVLGLHLVLRRRLRPSGALKTNRGKAPATARRVGTPALQLATRHSPLATVPGEWAWLAWPAALALSAIFGRYVSLEAFLLALVPLPLAWAACQGLLPARRLRAALLYGSAAESALAVLQYVGLDPFRLVWQPDLSGSSRMRVYGTLGNPDFVAAWLCATLPLYAVDIPGTRRGRFLRAAAFALQLAAIVATGSRVFLLAFPIALAVLLWHRKGRLRWCASALLALSATALLWFSPARPLSVTIQGRLYLARVAASHWREIPVFGYGPGSFRLQFVPWQGEWLRRHSGETNARMFAGPVDHAHNDYLEFAVEYGPAGLAAFLLLSAYLICRAWGARGRLAGDARIGVWAALASLLASACVDFPFHRPPEWVLYWVLLGILAAGDSVPGSEEEPETN